MEIKNTFLITGGCGFIGSALIRYLLRNKENIIIKGEFKNFSNQ